MAQKAGQAGETGGLGEALRFLYRSLGPERRRQFRASLLLMILGALAEAATIGAVIPFLALIADPAQSEQIGAVRFVFGLLGWEAGTPLIFPATALLVSVALAAAAIRMALAWYSQKFVFRLGHDIGFAIYARMLRQPYSYHVQRNSAEVVAGMEKVQSAIFSVLMPLMQAVVSVFLGLFIIAALVAIDPVTALAAAAAMALVYLLVSFGTRSLLKRNSSIVDLRHTDRVKLVQEALGGIRDILLDRSQPIFEETFRRLDSQLRDAQAVNAFVARAPRFVVEAAGIALIALLAAYMSTRPGGVVAAIPVLGALALGAQRLLPLLQIVYAGWSQFMAARAVLMEIVRLMRAPVIEEPDTAGALPFARGIRFEQVSYLYAGGGRRALREVDLDIAKGERIGLIGRTGSGKSTLLDLLMGLLEPTSGRILIDGRPLDAGGRAAWQARIAHVPQAIFLADSSIAANIAFGARAGEIDQARIEAAAARAQIHDFIAGLPDGYDTRIGERGVRLSGGQRQRLGIARALYRRASVLVFDEATSALDDETEAAVMASLWEGGRDLTIFMVAHRLSTLAGCDRLVRLEGGRVAAIGSYGELVGAAA
jgi:ATP-binding cassette, subfamily B, bacterial PglK